MGKYSVGYHGPKCHHDLGGVVTLTHNPLALENVSRERRYEAEAEEMSLQLDDMKKRFADLVGVPKESIIMRAVGTSSRPAK